MTNEFIYTWVFVCALWICMLIIAAWADIVNEIRKLKKEG